MNTVLINTTWAGNGRWPTSPTDTTNAQFHPAIADLYVLDWWMLVGNLTPSTGAPLQIKATCSDAVLSAMQTAGVSLTVL
jgi:hypothetical protein